MSYFDRLLFLIESPLDWLRRITLPPCEPEKYEKILIITWPFPGLIFTIWALNMFSMANVWKASGLAFVLSYLFYATQRDLKAKELPSPRYFLFVSILGTVYGLLWTYIASVLLMDLLALYVIVLKLDTTFMGLTVLGIGNALPDALTTVALSKKGYA
jgi:Ca2+/Na+ antiporter